VIRTRAGYCGGQKQDPTYHDLGDHTETFQLDYDPLQLSYQEILDIFWNLHDPFSKGYSTQYKAAVFYADAEQRRLAEESKDRLEQDSGKTVQTEILPLTEFYRAEDYHQKYYLRHNAVLMNELLSIYGSEREFIDSTLAARLNSYTARHGFQSVLAQELESYGLSEQGAESVRTFASLLDEGAFSGGACGVPQ